MQFLIRFPHILSKVIVNTGMLNKHTHRSKIVFTRSSFKTTVLVALIEFANINITLTRSSPESEIQKFYGLPTELDFYIITQVPKVCCH